MLIAAASEHREGGLDGLAAGWAEASWVSGLGESEPTHVRVHGIGAWRKELDGVWRVALERIG